MTTANENHINRVPPSASSCDDEEMMDAAAPIQSAIDMEVDNYLPPTDGNVKSDRKRPRRVSTMNTNDIMGNSEIESNSSDESTEEDTERPNSKRQCLPQAMKVSIIDGDMSAPSASSNNSESSINIAQSNPPHSARPPIVRRVSVYLDDIRSQLAQSLGSSGNQVVNSAQALRTRNGLGGTSTPRLVTPSSSFLTGAKDPKLSLDIAEGETHSKADMEDERTRQSKESTSIAEDDTAPAHMYQPAPKQQRRTRLSWKSILFTRIVPFLVLLEGALLIAERVFDLPFDPTFSLHGQPIKPNSIYVPGAGFSGFWFTLGRLRSIANPELKSYYCYSAGCLGVVATLANRTMEEMYDIASGAQKLWKAGTISRYEVVPRFVDLLLDLPLDDGMDAPAEDGSRSITKRSNLTSTVVPTPIMADANLLSKIHIITTTKEVMGIKHVIRTPKSIQELREGLIHTTWIPFATGGGLWNYDEQSGDHHMDGAFSATTHPRCTLHLGLPFMMDLFLNVINVNLGRDKVEKYWDAGIEFGSGL